MLNGSHIKIHNHKSLSHQPGARYGALYLWKVCKTLRPLAWYDPSRLKQNS